MASFSEPRTKAMTSFLKREAHRVTGLSIEAPEADGDKASVWIYTDSTKWHNGDGSGSFRGTSESSAINRFYRTVTKAE